MNTFSITLAPFNERETPTGAQVSLRSVESGQAEIVIRRHKSGPKGGTWTEELLGRVHASDLQRVLGAVLALTGGHCG